MVNDGNIVVITHDLTYAFVKNFTVAAIVSKLKMKCKYDEKGCREEVEIGLMDAHLRNCSYRPCDTCGQSRNAYIGQLGFIRHGRSDSHDCLTIMKEVMNQMKVKNQYLELKITLNERNKNEIKS